MVLNPGMMQPLFTTDTGRYILYYTVGSVVFGSVLIRRIARIDV